MHIHTRLVEERERLGLTQTEMAKQGGVAFRTYCDYESGKSEPRASFFFEASRQGLDVQYVVTGHRSGSTMKPDEEMVLVGYRKLDERGRAGVLALISGMQPPTEKKHRTEMVFKGAVGSVNQGDYHQNEALILKVGSKPKRKAKAKTE
ncbi:helix-turn-helix domain-containing protein [Cupriavidus plantarum]|uniref:helix-turn-helix domain-containing protein n=1 Tax=Cupriavidus plantarum TaxID=942865 RepID=UPI000E28520A|nr:helix-turn-helix transcriptional regulator [Cupriavidus plantarum]REE92624.1 helix-turn-helix protein [Cupriavidus plantarum]